MNKAYFLSLRLLVLVLLPVHLLPATTVVLPGDRATVEGNGATFTGTMFGSNTLQLQIAESELLAQGLLAGYAITGLSWRLNDTATVSPESTISDLEILLGQAVNTVAGMSSTFADNVVNGVLAYDDAYTFTAGGMPTGGSPNGFGPGVTFTTPYSYQGGDLILQVRRQPASAGFAWDASSTHVGAGTHYQAVTGSFTATSGAMTAHFPVMQLSYAVPEPSTWMTLAAGVALMALGRFRRAR